MVGEDDQLSGRGINESLQCNVITPLTIVQHPLNVIVVRTFNVLRIQLSLIDELPNHIFAQDPMSCLGVQAHRVGQ